MNVQSKGWASGSVDAQQQAHPTSHPPNHMYMNSNKTTHTCN
jgi:hypothetical protein